MRHKACGNVFDKNVHDIMTKGSGCPYCNGAKPKLYNEDWVGKNTPEPYEYVSGYTNMRTKCIFHCNKCNTDFLQFPSRLINEHIYGCNCSGTKRLTHEDFLNRLGPECLNEYTILGTYVNIDTPILMEHNSCHTQFEISPYKFISRQNKKYCPICYYKKSHGEILIANELTKMGIPFKHECGFQDFPGYRFDFFLPTLNTVIEFDGRQHFQFIPYFHKTEENFYLRQQKDKDKNEYCLNNNLTLYRIPYYEEEDLPEILTQIFIEKSSTTIEKFIVKKQ